MSASDEHKPGVWLRHIRDGASRASRAVLGTTLALAMAGAGLVAPSTAMAIGGGAGATTGGSTGTSGGGEEYRWWAYDNAERTGNAIEDSMKKWSEWVDVVVNDATNRYSIDANFNNGSTGACDLAYTDAIRNFPTTDGHASTRADFRIVLVGTFLGNATAGEAGKTIYLGKPRNGKLQEALDNSWDSLKTGLQAEASDRDAYLKYVYNLAKGQATSNGGDVSHVCVVLNKEQPETAVMPHTSANPQGTVSAGRQNVSDTTTFTKRDGTTPATINKDGTLSANLHYKGGRFVGADIPAGTGDKALKQDYRKGDASVSVSANDHLVFPGNYEWDTSYSAGTKPGELKGKDDAHEQFGANAPPIVTQATTSMLSAPAKGTDKESVDEIDADIDKSGAVGDIIDEMAKHNIQPNYTLTGTDELCYVPSAIELNQLPQALKDKIAAGKGDGQGHCTDGLISSGHTWNSRNGAKTSVSIKPRDLGLPSGGWLPGHYYYVLKIDANKDLGSDAVWLVGNDPEVEDEESSTPVYGYTQSVSTDKDLSNKNGVIIAGSAQPVWDYFTTKFFNNDDQTNGNYWTPTGNVPPTFTVRHTLHYVPDDTAKQAGIAAKDVTKSVKLNANGDNQKSAGYVPGDFGWAVWPSGLYYWSTEINNQDNKDVAKFCGANGDVPCMQNESRILTKSTADGQVVVTGEPTSTDGEGWVANGKTVWNGAGTTEPIESLKQTYDDKHKPVITINGHEGNVSRDLANGAGSAPANFGKGEILMDEMESFYAIFPQWVMKDFATDESFAHENGKAGVIENNNSERAHDRLTWTATPVDSDGNATQGADGSPINVPALSGLEPISVTGAVTLTYTPTNAVKNTLKAGKQTVNYTIRPAMYPGRADVPDAPDFSPAGFAAASGQSAAWSVWEPGTYVFSNHIGATQDNFLYGDVNDDGSNKNEQFIVRIPQVGAPVITTTTKAPGTWQDVFKVSKPSVNGKDQWTALAGGDFWDRWVTGDAMGATYSARIDHNDNVLQTDQANNPAPGQKADGKLGTANPKTDSSVTRVADGKSDGSAVSKTDAGVFGQWNWEGTVTTPVFTHADFRKGQGSTIAKDEDAWKSRKAGTYWFETEANFHAGLTPEIGNVVRDTHPDVSGQSDSVNGTYVPMGAMDPYAIDNTDGTKLTLSYRNTNANNRYKDEYFYNYSPTISTRIDGLSAVNIAGAGPKPDGPVVDKITTANSGMPESTVYNATLTLHYSPALPTDNVWAAGAVKTPAKSVDKHVALKANAADQVPEGDKWTPADFGWKQWQAGSYWVSISTEQTDSQQADAVKDLNIDNTDVDEQFLVVPSNGRLDVTKTGSVKGADGKDKGQTFNKVGDKVTWKIKVSNPSKTTLDFSLTDGKPEFTGSGKLTAISCPATKVAANEEGKGKLGPGESVTCTVGYTITQTDMDNPEWDILNQANVHYTGADGTRGDATSNGALVSQTGGTGAKITVGKAVAQVLDTRITDPEGNGGAYKAVPRDEAKPIAADKDGRYAASAGDTIDYTITVTNSGDHTLDNLSVTDPLIERQIQDDFDVANGVMPDVTVHCPAGATGEGSTLKPGESFTCTASYILTQQDVDSGKVTNTATATSRQVSGSATVDDGTVTTPIEPNKELTDKKTSDFDGKNYAKGDKVTYTATTTNTGNVTLHNVGINDPGKADGFNGHGKLEFLGCTVVSNNVVKDGNVFNDVEGGAVENGKATLKPGDTLKCQWSTTVTQEDVDGNDKGDWHTSKNPENGGEIDYSQLVNTACGTAEDGKVNGKCATDTIISPTKPDLKITKTADKSHVQKAGDKIQYTITMTNTGNVTLHDVYLADYMPGVSDLKCEGFTLATSPNKYDSDDLAPGQKVVCTAEYTVTQHDIDTGSDYDITALGDPAVADPDKDPSGWDKNTEYDMGNAKDWADKDFKEVPAVINVACVSYIGPHGESINPQCVGHTTSVGDTPAIGEGQSLSLSKRAWLSDDPTATAKPLGDGWSVNLTKAGSAIEVNGLNGKDKVEVTVSGEAAQVLTTDANGHVAATLKPAAKADKLLMVRDATNGAILFHGKPVSGGKIVSGKLAGAAKASAGWYVQLSNDGTQVVVIGANAGDAINVTAGAKATSVAVTADQNGRAVAGLDPAAQAGDYLTVIDASTGATLFDAFPSEDGLKLIDGTLASSDKAMDKPKDGANDKVVSYDKVGQSVTFEVTSTNNGRLNLTGVVINDDAKTGFTGTGTLAFAGAKVVKANDKDEYSKLGKDGSTADLAPGAKLVATYTYAVTQADLDAGSVTNTAVSSGQNLRGDPRFESNKATVTINADQQPKLNLKKSSNFDNIGYQEGQSVLYNFRVTNAGNVTMHSISIDDSKFDGHSKLSNVVCPTDTLAPGASVDCTAQYTTVQGDVDQKSIRNTAVATGQSPKNVKTDATDSHQLDTYSPGDSLSVVKSVDQPSTGDITKAGQVIHYRFLATNNGGRTLTNVSITDAHLPAGTPIYRDPDNSTAPVASLAPGASVEFHADYTVTQADIDAGHVENVAVGHFTDSTGKDGTTDSNKVDTPTNHVEGLKIVKKADKASVSKAGETITYTFTITNGSKVRASNLSIDDPNLKGAEIKLAATELEPGATTTATAVYTVTQADIDAGKALTNVATAFADSPKANGRVHDMTAVSNETTVKVTGASKLAVSKKSDTTSTNLKAGDVLNYTITVENQGDTTVHNVHVADSLLPADKLTCDPAINGEGAQAIAPGAKVVCTGSYTITDEDVAAGKVVNTVRADGTDERGDNVPSNEDKVVNPIVYYALSFSKSAKATTLKKAGDKVDYTFQVTNTGNQALHDIAIKDALLEAYGEKITGTKGEALKDLGATLEPGKSITLKATHVTTDEQLAYAKANGSKLTNEAEVTTKEQVGAKASVDTPVDYTPEAKPSIKPSIRVVETIDPKSVSEAGQKLTMTFTVTNTGDTALDNVSLTDPLFKDGDYDYATSASNPTKPANGQVKLAPGESIVATAVYTVTQADIDRGSIKSPVTVTGRYGIAPKDDADAAKAMSLFAAPLMATVSGSADATVAPIPTVNGETNGTNPSTGNGDTEIPVVKPGTGTDNGTDNGSDNGGTDNGESGTVTDKDDASAGTTKPDDETDTTKPDTDKCTTDTAASGDNGKGEVTDDDGCKVDVEAKASITGTKSILSITSVPAKGDQTASELTLEQVAKIGSTATIANPDETLTERDLLASLATLLTEKGDDTARRTDVTAFLAKVAALKTANDSGSLAHAYKDVLDVAKGEAAGSDTEWVKAVSDAVLKRAALLINATDPNAKVTAPATDAKTDSDATSRKPAAKDEVKEGASNSYAKCEALNKDYPYGVVEGHPAYSAKLDGDKDGIACETTDTDQSTTDSDATDKTDGKDQSKTDSNATDQSKTTVNPVDKNGDLPKGTKAGDIVTYGFTITNNGKVSLYQVTADDKVDGVSEIALGKPDALDDPSKAPADIPDLAGLTLAPGQSVSGTATYVITDKDVAAGKIANTVTYSAVTAKKEPVSADASVEAKIPAPGIATGIRFIRQQPVAAIAIAVLLLGVSTAGIVFALRKRRS